ncbi:unnamed protein product [Closterium sp. Naga37s-1]|nr:unnamed protein product [Closterium sp. Naga37s-1]
MLDDALSLRAVQCHGEASSISVPIRHPPLPCPSSAVLSSLRRAPEIDAAACPKGLSHALVKCGAGCNPTKTIKLCPTSRQVRSGMQEEVPTRLVRPTGPCCCAGCCPVWSVGASSPVVSLPLSSPPPICPLPSPSLPSPNPPNPPAQSPGPSAPPVVPSAHLSLAPPDPAADAVPIAPRHPAVLPRPSAPPVPQPVSPLPPPAVPAVSLKPPPTV